MKDEEFAKGPVAYILKRYPRLSETFILNEIRALERGGANLRLFSLLPPEPPPHHPMVAEVRAPVQYMPQAWGPKIWAVCRAHGALIAHRPFAYAKTLAVALSWCLASNPFKIAKQFLRAGFIGDACRRVGAGSIHAHFANAPTAVAQLVSSLCGIPYSFTTHAKDLYLTRDRLLRRRVRGATFVATCTGFNQAHLRRILPDRDRHKIHLIYHGIDLGPFTGERHDCCGENRPAPLILSVGRLVPKKGMGDLIQACAVLRDRGVSFRCAIVGDGPLRGELQAQIARAGLEESVNLLGAMAHDALIALYEEASVFALSPLVTEDGDRDGIPNVIVEAMAARVPVVTTDVSGIPELVRDGQTGYLVPPRQPEQLAEKIADVLNHPGKALPLAQAAWSRLQADFDVWRNTQSLQALLARNNPLAAPWPQSRSTAGVPEPS